MKFKITLIMIPLLLLTGCTAGTYTELQFNTVLSNCTSNSGIQWIALYSSSEVYSVKCNDGALFEYLKFKDSEKGNL